ARTGAPRRQISGLARGETSLQLGEERASNRDRASVAQRASGQYTSVRRCFSGVFVSSSRYDSQGPSAGRCPSSVSHFSNRRYSSDRVWYGPMCRVFAARPAGSLVTRISSPVSMNEPVNGIPASVSNAAEAGIPFTGSLMLTGDEIRVTKLDRKSTRLNSSHVAISYVVFCFK